MGRRRSCAGFWAGVALAAMGCCPPAGAGQAIHGAGATFPAPVYAAWSAAYQRSSGVSVTYEPVGSGAGIQRIRLHEVDFGASDAPLTAQELAAAGLMQFPVVVGGVVPIINMSGIKPGQLRMSGALLADIYLGRIRKWNDPALRALNPTLELPNANITVVHRSEASGSSLLWTDYLSRSSPAWRSAVGASLAPAWPSGIGGTGNEGVASYVQRTRFAIGYVEYIFARKHNLSDVALRNRNGRFVEAGLGTFRAAAEAADWHATAGGQQLATDQPGPQSWPITGASFILVDRSSEAGAQALEVLRFFRWALHEGVSMARELDYLPVPEAVVSQLQHPDP